MLIKIDENKSILVNCSPSNLFERIELNTRLSEDIDDTVIISVIDNVPIHIKYTDITDENKPGHRDARKPHEIPYIFDETLWRCFVPLLRDKTDLHENKSKSVNESPQRQKEYCYYH